MKKENYYEKLFINNEVKATAFDKIAKKYFYGNFGTMSKSDFETLLFSEYFDVIKKGNSEDDISWSDYELSKQLGITQARITNLKVKKELQYPNEDGDLWKKELIKDAKNIKFVNESILLYVIEKNVFIEAKNTLIKNGCIPQETDTNNLFVLDKYSFLCLMSECYEQKEQIYKTFKMETQKNATWEDVFKKHLKDDKVAIFIECVLGLLPPSYALILKTAKIIKK